MGDVMKHFLIFCFLMIFTALLFAQFPESFESGMIPSNWTVYNLDGDAKQFVAYQSANNTAYDGSWVARVGFNPSGNNDWLISPLLNITNDQKVIRFWARSSEIMYFEDFNVKLSTSGNLTQNFTINLNSYTNIPNQWIEYRVDLSPYVGQSVYLGIQVVSIDKYIFKIDQFEWVAPGDLQISNISGQDSITNGQTLPYSFTVTNIGQNIQSHYSVQLYQNENVYASQNGTSLNPGESVTYTFNWTPSSVQAYTLYGKVSLPNDINCDNDFTNQLSVIVHPQQNVVLTVGDPNVYAYSNILPMNLNYRNSVSQMIYYTNEINMAGYINSIVFYSDLVGDAPENTPIKIWMANTTVSSFQNNNDWIPINQFTLVYDGAFNGASNGICDIFLSLDTPFLYQGNNLAIMVQKPYEVTSYNYYNRWNNDNYSSNVFRSLSLASNNIIDPLLAQAGVRYTSFPLISFVINTNGLSLLTGQVSSDNSPLSGVNVSVSGTNFQAQTNSFGQYIFPSLSSDNVSLSLSKPAYFEQTISNIALQPNQTSFQNISMTHLPTVNISARVLSNDSGSPLDNCLIRLTGFENFQTSTSSDGYFSFNAVCVNQVCQIQITKNNFQTYTASFNVESSDLILSDIILYEIAYPPLNVMAVVNNNHAEITWQNPFENRETLVSNTSIERSLLYFDVWRSNVTTIDNPENWVQVASNVTATNFTDTAWQSLVPAQYRYIVKAVYSGNINSEPSLSNILQVITTVSFSISTSNGLSPQGTCISMKNISDLSQPVLFSYAQNNSIQFTNVPYGTYQIFASKSGYQLVIQDSVVINQHNYIHPTIVLVENLVYFSENFENPESSLNTWSFIDQDGDSYNWFIDTSGSAHSGNNCIASASYLNNIGALTPDNIFILPVMGLTEPMLYYYLRISYFVSAQNQEHYQEHYSLMFSNTDTQINSFTTFYSETLQHTGFQERLIALPYYSNQLLYIAFRHHNISNMSLLKFDDIQIHYYLGNGVTPEITLKTALKNNSPNPFNPSTSIAFDLSQPENVCIDIFNVKGQKVKTLTNQFYQAGSHSVMWNGKDDSNQNVSSGIYFFNMKSGKYTSTRKMILLK